MMDWFWSAVQTCARLIGFLARIDTRSSIGISVVAFLLTFFSETELSKVLDQKSADWAAIGAKAVFLIFLIMLSARHGAALWRKLQALSNGVAIEVPITDKSNPFVFRNTHARGPLHGEVLHYELRLRLTALRNLRDARAFVTTFDRGRRQLLAELPFEDFHGSAPRGHENTIVLATLEIEQRGMTSGSGIVPHSETSPVRMQLFGRGEFEEVGAGNMREFNVTVRHASGAVTSKLLLWVLSGVPTPGTVEVLDGPMSLKQTPLAYA
jgi:hypothetical protein